MKLIVNKFLTSAVAFFIVTNCALAQEINPIIKTKKIRVEVHDINSMNNPIKSLNGTKLSVKEAVKRIGRLGKNSALVIACEGNFPLGYIANDLISPGGRWNREFSVNDNTMLLDICIAQEASFAGKRR